MSDNRIKSGPAAATNLNMDAKVKQAGAAKPKPAAPAPKPADAVPLPPERPRDLAQVGAKPTEDATKKAIAGAQPAAGEPDLAAGLAKLKGDKGAKADKALQRFRENDPAQVKDVQQKLKDLGHYQGEVDGKYGEKTDKAVRDFQAKNKDAEGKALKADGSVGEKTKGALEKAAKDKAPAGGAAKPVVTPEQATALASDPKLNAEPVDKRNAAAEVAPKQEDAQKLAVSAMTTDPGAVTPKAVENAAQTSPQATELVGKVADKREETPNQVVAAMQPDSAAALAGVHAKDGNGGAAAQTVYATPPAAQPAVAAKTFQGPGGGAAATSFLDKSTQPASQGTPNDLQNIDAGTLRNAIAAIERDMGQPGVGTRAQAKAGAARRELERRGETP